MPVPSGVKPDPDRRLRQGSPTGEPVRSCRSGGRRVFHSVPGSGLDGHRSPIPEWYLSVAKDIYKIHKRSGFTFKQLVQCRPADSMLEADVFRIEEGIPFEDGIAFEELRK